MRASTPCTYVRGIEKGNTVGRCGLPARARSLPERRKDAPLGALLKTPFVRAFSCSLAPHSCLPTIASRARDAMPWVCMHPNAEHRRRRRRRRRKVYSRLTQEGKQSYATGPARAGSRP